MCKKKNQSSSEEITHTMNDHDTDTSDDSDVSMSDSDSDSDGSVNDQNETLDDEDLQEDDNKASDVEDEEEEDEVIKAIRNECEKKRDRPPKIVLEEFITDISFHPHEDLIAAATTDGNIEIYKYTNEENTLLHTSEVHTKSCRDIEFSQDGKVLFSSSKDKSIMMTDVETCKLVRFYDDAHDAPIHCLTVIDENRFATGDDNGTVKLWDLRQKSDKPIYKTKKNEDYISDMISDDAHKYLLCSSGDGSLLSIDLENRKIFMLSEEYEEELTCLGIFRSDTKLVAGSTKGRLYMYNWQEFGLHSDAFPGLKCAINDLIPITEHIVVTACEDGFLRATHLFPHRHLGVVGQHEFSVEKVDINHNGQFIASCSHDNDIEFWNIQYFEDFEKISSRNKKHERRKDVRRNLPSSRMKDASDFFSGLA